MFTKTQYKVFRGQHETLRHETWLTGYLNNRSTVIKGQLPVKFNPALVRKMQQKCGASALAQAGAIRIEDGKTFVVTRLEKWIPGEGLVTDEVVWEGPDVMAESFAQHWLLEQKKQQITCTVVRVGGGWQFTS